MGVHGLHNWWYRCLQRAGIVPVGVTSGERMHKARHTAGQHVLDVTGNLKAVQKLLGHESIATTGDTNTDWDIDRLAKHTRRRSRMSKKAIVPQREEQNPCKSGLHGGGGNRTPGGFRSTPLHNARRRSWDAPLHDAACEPAETVFCPHLHALTRM
jgi:hypothetical protein